MGSGKKRSKRDKFREARKRYYNRIGKVTSQALKREVEFNEDGWRHITNPKLKTPSEIDSKLQFLPEAVQIIKNAVKYTPRWSHDRVESFTFCERIGNRMVYAVVIRPGGKYQFRTTWSEITLT